MDMAEDVIAEVPEDVIHVEEEEEQQNNDDEVDALFESAPAPAEAGAGAEDLFSEILILRPTLALICCTPLKRTLNGDGKIDSPAFCMFAEYCKKYGCQHDKVVDRELALITLYMRKLKQDAMVCTRNNYKQEEYDYLASLMSSSPQKQMLLVLQDEHGTLKAWSSGKCAAYIVLETLINLGCDSADACVTHAVAMAKKQSAGETFLFKTLLENAVRSEMNKVFVQVKELEKIFKV